MQLPRRLHTDGLESGILHEPLSSISEALYREWFVAKAG
jgi:hypothetical protein